LHAKFYLLLIFLSVCNFCIQQVQGCGIICDAGSTGTRCYMVFYKDKIQIETIGRQKGGGLAKLWTNKNLGQALDGIGGNGMIKINIFRIEYFSTLVQ
jgi:hypothetical protein